VEAARDYSTITVRRTLFPAQQEIYRCPAKITIAVCGIRWGKSRTAADRLIDTAIETGASRNPQDVLRWTVPNYKLSKIAEDELARELPYELIRRHNKVDHEWELINGAKIDMRSAESPDSMLGRSHPFHVVEEAARISEDVWREYILPRTLDVDGRILIITTPKGKTHWTYRLFCKGNDPNEPRYKSFHYPSWTSPRITTEAVDMLAEDLGGKDSMAFRQEVGAEFLDEAAGVFMGHRKLATVEADEIGEDVYARKPEAGMSYVGGVDIAKVRDYTVIRIKGTDHSTWYRERFTGKDYNYIIARIAAVSEAYNHAVMYLDSTGVGDPVFDQLLQRGVNCEGYKFTSDSKQVLINGLTLAIAEGEIAFLKADDNLLSEMDIFEFSMTKSGRIRYEAPEGFHDDEVYAECLSEYGYQQRLAAGGRLSFGIG